MLMCINLYIIFIYSLKFYFSLIFLKKKKKKKSDNLKVFPNLYYIIIKLI